MSAEELYRDALGAEAPEKTVADIVDAFENVTGVDDVFALLKETTPPVDPIDQQLVRFKLAEVLKRWKIPVRSLDEWLKVKAAERAMTGIMFPEYEPWPEPVDGAELVADLEAYFARFVHAPPESLLAAALWSLWTYSFDLFDIAPLLVLTSPTKRCGKTTLLKAIGSVASRRLFSSNVTGAVLFRVIEKYRPTLLIDEADNFARFNDELKGLLNAGHERMTAQATRTVGDDHDVKTFSTWAPKAFTAIGSLPDTVEDRSIRLVMLRRPTDVPKERARMKALNAGGEPLARRCVRWAEDNAVAIRAATEPELEALHDRAADNWAPLVVIADLCGARARAEKAAEVLTTGAEVGVGELLLAHVREAFGAKDWLGTTELIEALVARDDGPWARWWAADAGDPGRRKKVAADLARKLRQFDPKIKADREQSDGKRERGYARAQFEDVWKRWLPTDAPSPGSGNHGHPGHLGQADPETPPLTSGDGVVPKVPKMPKVSTPSENVGRDGFRAGDVVRVDRERGRRFLFVEHREDGSAHVREVELGQASRNRFFDPDDLVLIKRAPAKKEDD